jgi:hypothetical protein
MMKTRFITTCLLFIFSVKYQTTQGQAIQKKTVADTAAFICSVSVQALENAASLSWKQVDETNTLYFEVQRSEDNVSFTPVLLMHAKGKNNYTYTDTCPKPSSYYYRLLITNVDGKEVYSQVVKAQLANSQIAKM